MSSLPAVFLDRDGVLNRAIIRNGQPYPPSTLAELEVLSGSIKSLAKLASCGYALIGITNQPDVARGVQSREMVEALNQVIKAGLGLREVFVCYHDDVDECDCRKPKPGLILAAAKKYDLDLSCSWMVGDRWKDIAAGQAAGLKTIFVDYHYTETYKGNPPDFIIEDTEVMAEIILKGT